ncbi:MAG: MDR family oxidoreductase [Burkholderiales bacterium]|nr:MDR family oxidoreductase [Burkholderiales bacterium]
MFKGLLLSKTDDTFSAEVKDIADSELPEGDVLVRIEYSTLNYKDALAICNKSPIVRKWPMVAGIDGAGVVEESNHPAWKPGDKVILNGFGVGESHWGCLAGKARLKGDWLVRLPDAFTPRQAMAIGTAGYTAMLCCLALERFGVAKGQGEILVTGASGGVGSIAVSILSGWGYDVVASTGKLQESDFLKSLGAKAVVDRSEYSQPGKPLQKERWAGAVDSVGSHTLVNVCAQTKYRGVVAACGLAQGMDFPASVAPFILRGVVLAGVDSVYQPLAVREAAWAKLAADLDRAKLDAITAEIDLSDAVDAAADLLAGKVRGRLVVKLPG